MKELFQQRKKQLGRRLKSRECISFTTVSKCISVNIFGIIWANILALDSKSGKFGDCLVLDCSTKRAYENLFLFFAGVGHLDSMYKKKNEKKYIFVQLNLD